MMVAVPLGLMKRLLRRDIDAIHPRGKVMSNRAAIRRQSLALGNPDEGSGVVASGRKSQLG